MVVLGVWLCFFVVFGFCLMLVGYCLATVLLEWGVCDEGIVPLGGGSYGGALSLGS